MQTLFSICDLERHLSALPDKYQYVYASIGSKQNEPWVHYSTTPPCKIQTNAPFQMIPSFMRILPDDHKGIIIVIDDLHNDDSRHTNESILRDLSLQCPCIDVILVDVYLTKEALTSILRVITEFSHKLDVSPENLKISNFVRFRQPNPSEQMLETWIPKTIQCLLDELCDGKYNICFYQWCGYAFATADYLYCYKTYNSGYMFYASTVHDILRKSIGTSPLSEYNKSDVSCSDMRSRMVWKQFQEHSISIV